MKLHGNITIIFYADDITVIGSSRAEVITKMVDLIAAAKLMRLKINQNNTKYMVIDIRTRDLTEEL